MIRVTCDTPSTEPRRFAVAELRRYLQMMNVEQSDIQLAVDPTTGLIDEGYSWEQAGASIKLTAGGDIGLVFGSYALLKELGGCLFSGLGPDGEYIPQRNALRPATPPVRREPKLWYRGIQFSEINNLDLFHQQIDWMAKNGFNYLTVMVHAEDEQEHTEIDPATGEPVGGIGSKKVRITEKWMDRFLLPEARKRGLKLDVNHHNLRFWLPPSKYMAEHPEWYAMYDGKRGANLAQLCICTSNQDAVNELINNVKAFLRRRPDVPIVGVIPEDGNGICQCENCRALDVAPADSDRPHDFRDPEDENRGLADRYAKLLNQVAKAVGDEFPDVLIGGAAYVDAQWPSRDIEYEKNITVWLATYWRDAARPLKDGVHSHINQIFVDLLKQWHSKLTAPLIEYGYYMGMNAQRGLPYPMARVMCQEFPELKQIGLQGSTIQCLVTCHHAYGLNLAAFAENAWHDSVDYDTLLCNYLLGMFGHAAPAIEPIYRAIEDATQQIAQMPQGELPGGIENGVMQPNGENAKFFYDRAGNVEGQLQQALALCQTDRERRQVQRFSHYVAYWRLAAEATSIADMQAIITYLESFEPNGWFAKSAPAKWRGKIKRMQTNQLTPTDTT